MSDEEDWGVWEPPFNPIDEQLVGMCSSSMLKDRWDSGKRSLIARAFYRGNDPTLPHIAFILDSGTIEAPLDRILKVLGDRLGLLDTGIWILPSWSFNTIWVGREMRDRLLVWLDDLEARFGFSPYVSTMSGWEHL